MKRTDLKKHAAALLLVLCLLVTSALPALATSANIKLVDSSGNPTTGTIRVTLYDSANDKALSGGKLTLYRVAEVKRQNGNLSYEYCGDFYGCGIALGDLTDSTLAAQLQEYLPQSAEGTTKTIDADGNVTFCGLELGLYLIVQTEASKGYEPINPFLVSLPMAEDGKWNYAGEVACVHEGGGDSYKDEKQVRLVLYPAVCQKCGVSETEVKVEEQFIHIGNPKKIQYVL